MSSRHPCISFVATVVVIINVGITSNAGASPPVSSTVTQKLQELSDAIHELTKAVSDHPSCKSVGTPPPQCQTMNYELAVSIGEIKAKVAQVSHAVEADANRVASLEDRVQKVETIASHGLQVSPDLEDRLQNQVQVVQAAVDKVAHFDQRLQQVQTVASQIQESFQDHVEEEASRKGSCRSPFYKVGNDCLFVDHVEKRTWENARRFCRAFEGDLAVPSDVLKLKEFVTTFEKGNFWIGGSDLLVEGDWRWLNGSEVDLSVGWPKGQPNNYKGEHCLHYYEQTGWSLNDHQCSQLMHFVCQDALYA